MRGVQAGGVAATVKHFVANDSETQRFTLDARVDERALRERYLAPFEPIVREAGVWAVMAAYNSINGVTATEHPMLAEVLKDEWGFDGVVMSDWYAARSTEPAANAGLDLVMPGPGGRGATGWSPRSVTAACPRRRSTTSCCGCCGSPPVSAPWTASSRPRQPPTRGRRRRSRPSCGSAAAGFVLLGNAQVEAAPALPWTVRPCAGWPCSAPTPRSRGPSAAAAPRCSRPTPSRWSRACGPPWARASRSTTAGGCAAPTGSRSPRWPCSAAPTAAAGVEVRFLAADGTVRGREDRTTGAFNWLSRFGPDLPIAEVAAVEVHTRLRAPEPGTYLWAAPGSGPCG